MSTPQESQGHPIPLDEALRRDFFDLRLDDYAPLFSAIAARQNDADTPQAPSDRGVVQYWDTSPDEQVRSLLEANRSQCDQASVPWHFFDNERAIDFLDRELGSAYVHAYRKCMHPAQRSDFFRYCYIYRRGGMWLDADLVLTASPEFILSSPVPIFFQRKRSHGGITNAFLYAPANNPIFASIVETCLQNLEDDTLFQESEKTRDILCTTGVVMINRIVASYAHTFLASTTGSERPMTIIDETVHQQFVERGENYLGRSLAYKRTDRSWQTWCREAPANPLDPEVMSRLRNATLR